MSQQPTGYILDAAALQKLSRLLKDFYRSHLNLSGSPTDVRRDPGYFWGKITSAGGSTNTYSVSRQVIPSNSSGSSTASVTTTDAAGDWAQTVTATNIAETSTSNTLAVGTIVQVFYDYDLTTSGDPVVRYWFEAVGLPSGVQYQVFQRTLPSYGPPDALDYVRFHG